MTLRPDITFHNGTPLTSQTIVDMFPIQQAGAAGSSAIDVGQAGQCRGHRPAHRGVHAQRAERGVPRRRSPALPSACRSIRLLAAADSAAYSTAPVGTGPFVIKSRDIDNETVVEKNPDYWRTDEQGNQLPYLDSISFRPIPDEGTRLDALLSGTVTAMQSLRQGTIRDARAESGIELIEFQGNSTGGGYVQHRRSRRSTTSVCAWA